MRLSAPLDRSTRSVAADWVELQVLVTDREVSEQQLLRARSTQAEPDHGDLLTEIDLDAVDNEILEVENDELSQRVHEELSYRERVLGDLYPFELAASYGKWVLQRRTSEQTATRAAHDCYLGCLLISAMHSELLPIPTAHDLFLGSARVMQIESFLAAAEILGGRAYWFGSPRPDHSGMLLAVQRLVGTMGLGEAPASRPTGVSPNTNDGTVDIVAWRPFLDGQPGALVAYGQVAAGRNWRSKPIKAFIEGDFLPWFVKHPSHKFIELLFVPILQHHELAERRNEDFWDVAREEARNRERNFGIVIDRLRLTELTASANANARLPDDHESHAADAHAWAAEALAYAAGQDQAA